MCFIGHTKEGLLGSAIMWWICVAHLYFYGNFCCCLTSLCCYLFYYSVNIMQFILDNFIICTLVGFCCFLVHFSFSAWILGLAWCWKISLHTVGIYYTISVHEDILWTWRWKKCEKGESGEVKSLRNVLGLMVKKLYIYKKIIIIILGWATVLEGIKQKCEAYIFVDTLKLKQIVR